MNSAAKCLAYAKPSSTKSSPHALLAPNVWIAFAVCLFAGLATVIGAAFLLRAERANPRLLAFGLAFAGGAMVYVSLAEIFVKSQLAFAESFADKQAYSYATLAFSQVCCCWCWWTGSFQTRTRRRAARLTAPTPTT